MTQHLTCKLNRTSALAAGTAASIYLPTITTITLGLALATLAFLTLIGTLAKHKTRRDAAHTMLKLLLGDVDPAPGCSTHRRQALRTRETQ